MVYAVWMDQLARREALHDDVLEPILQSLADQLAWLARNLETDLGGNHLVKNLLALRWGAACFEGPDAVRWGELADEHLITQLAIQVPDDGRSGFASSVLWCLPLRWWLDATSAVAVSNELSVPLKKSSRRISGVICA